MFASIQSCVLDSANFVPLSYFDHTTDQMTTQELLLCEYLAAADHCQHVFISLFFPYTKLTFPSQCLICFQEEQF